MTSQARSGRARLALALLAASVIPAVASAQQLGASAIVVSADHRLLSDPLVGGRLELQRGRLGGPAALLFSLDHVRGGVARIGRPCGGMIQPGTCEPEPLRDDGWMTSANAGAAVRLLGGARAMLALNAGLSLALVHVKTRGLESGKIIRAEKLIWGPSAGLTTAWSPTARVPLALQLGGSLGVMVPVYENRSYDSYTPFENTITLRGLQLGVVWHGL